MWDLTPTYGSRIKHGEILCIFPQRCSFPPCLWPPHTPFLPPRPHPRATKARPSAPQCHLRPLFPLCVPFGFPPGTLWVTPICLRVPPGVPCLPLGCPQPSLGTPPHIPPYPFMPLWSPPSSSEPFGAPQSLSPRRGPSPPVPIATGTVLLSPIPVPGCPHPP